MYIPDKFYNEPLSDDKTTFMVQLKISGLLKKMYTFGIISPIVFQMIEARLKVKALMDGGTKKGDAVKFVASAIGRHPKHVYTYLR